MAYAERYVRADAAGGGDGTTNTNSGANGAFTIVEAAANAGTGIRYNVKAGTYTLAADLTITAGATESPNQWRGFNSTIGDLVSVGRDSATGELTDTNFPLIDGGTLYRMIFTSFTSAVNMSFTNSLNGAVVSFGTSASIFAIRCKFASTNASGSSVTTVTTGDNKGAFVDCDFCAASTNSNLIILSTGRNTAYGCKVWHTGTPNAGSRGIVIIDVGGAVIKNIVHSVGIGIDTSNVASPVIENTVYSCVTGIRLNNNGSVIANNVSDSITGYLFGGVASSGNPLLWSNHSVAPTSGRIDTANAGTIIEEINGVVLSGSPFTNAGSVDFTLDNTSGEGAACRGGNLLWAGHSDIGAVQHAETAGGGSALHLGSLGQTGIGAF